MKENKCEICQISFGGKSDLKRHQRTVHENEKPSKCKICLKLLVSHVISKCNKELFIKIKAIQMLNLEVTGFWKGIKELYFKNDSKSISKIKQIFVCKKKKKKKKMKYENFRCCVNF